MALGSIVRRMFGRHERLISDLWRAMFINLDDLTRQLLDWSPNARNILEIGCGEGGVTERLAASYCDATILGIDIADNIGRLYQGPTDRVSFRKMTVQELAAEHPGAFDLIVMCDVMHHIPPALRNDILSAARSLLAPSGKFIFKDWVRTLTPVHGAAFAADRWLTGDDVQFLSSEEAEKLLATAFDQSPALAHARIKPWRNNFAVLLRPGE